MIVNSVELFLVKPNCEDDSRLFLFVNLDFLDSTIFSNNLKRPKEEKWDEIHRVIWEITLLELGVRYYSNFKIIRKFFSMKTFVKQRSKHRRQNAFEEFYKFWWDFVCS